MSQFKYQEQFASDLTACWLKGDRNHVRLTIRGLKNKPQASYVAARIALNLVEEGKAFAGDFVNFMHPNQ
ncbi:hypothetical protein [Limnoglobus roseus]|uniref:Uncharacterized protein n=1 Tax=Limnoglobus roseus TaxID=2598579 RepID=A0A5C1AMT6_9BACT|nr:hypothetical protein [Limnoglobus roseus]QEL19296.1 hypothetical protein PX52LOC_06360 [Limnoglobus roseus]